MKILHLGPNYEDYPQVFTERYRHVLKEEGQKRGHEVVIYGPGYKNIPFFSKDCKDIIAKFGVPDAVITLQYLAVPGQGQNAIDYVQKKTPEQSTASIVGFPTNLGIFKNIPVFSLFADWWGKPEQNSMKSLNDSVDKPYFLMPAHFDACLFPKVKWPGFEEIDRSKFNKTKTIYFPWAVELNRFPNNNLEILNRPYYFAPISNPYVYPYRSRYLQVAKEIAPHLGLTPISGYGNLTISEWSKQLCSCQIGFTDGSAINFPVTKYFEIPAAGCILCARKLPILEKLGFIDGVNYIADTDDNTFGEKIRNVFRICGKAKEIQQAGLTLIKQKHTIQVRCNQLLDIIEAIVKGKYNNSTYLGGNLVIN